MSKLTTDLIAELADLRERGLSISAIAKVKGLDRKTVAKGLQRSNGAAAEGGAAGASDGGGSSDVQTSASGSPAGSDRLPPKHSSQIEGELASKLFTLFEAGKSDIQAVQEMRLPPDHVRKAREAYNQMKAEDPNNPGLPGAIQALNSRMDAMGDGVAALLTNSVLMGEMKRSHCKHLSLDRTCKMWTFDSAPSKFVALRSTKDESGRFLIKPQGFFCALCGWFREK